MGEGGSVTMKCFPQAPRVKCTQGAGLFWEALETLGEVAELEEAGQSLGDRTLRARPPPLSSHSSAGVTETGPSLNYAL